MLDLMGNPDSCICEAPKTGFLVMRIIYLFSITVEMFKLNFVEMFVFVTARQWR